jgi:micrococcal nuclease
MRLVIYLIIYISAFSCQTVKSPKSAEWWRVTEVVDVDTFHALNSAGEHYKIRLIGLDAPETRRTGKKEIGYYGKESGNFLDEMLNGKKVRLEFDVTQKDRFGRTLAYVYLEDGTFVNAELIRKGYARVMTIPPNVRYADEFIRMQKKARKQKNGLWKEPLND